MFGQHGCDIYRPLRPGEGKFRAWGNYRIRARSRRGGGPIVQPPGNPLLVGRAPCGFGAGSRGGNFPLFAARSAPKEGFGAQGEDTSLQNERAGGGLGAARPLFLPHGPKQCRWRCSIPFSVPPSPSPLLHPLLRSSIPSSGSRGTRKPVWGGEEEEQRHGSRRPTPTLQIPAWGARTPQKTPPEIPPKNHARQRIHPSGRGGQHLRG